MTTNYSTSLLLSIAQTQSLLTDFLNDTQSQDNLLTAFGDEFDPTTGLTLLQSLVTDDLTSLVNLEILPSAEINYAAGAYSSSNNTIYLATELLDSGDTTTVTRVLLEEIGHYLDAQGNSIDAPGDEGAIFAALVLGTELDSNQLALLQTEADTATVTIDGESLDIEQMRIIYVDQSAGGANDGSTWTNAYRSLQSALSAATAGDEIWVADGTYLTTTGTDRGTSFVIPNDVKVYGGFAGGETELSQRRFNQNVAILSGDIGTTDDISDNSYHVVTLSDVTRDTVLDGFTIRDGNANSSTAADRSGGGIYAANSSATLINLNITDNNARFGGGMYTENSQHQIANLNFFNNSAITSGDGGGLYISNSIDSFDNVTFGYNFSTTEGGGIYNNRSTLNLNNVEFIANRANRSGGGIYNSASSRFSLSNGVFLNNSALDNGGGIFNLRSSSGAEFAISDTIFKNNVADLGGGIYNNQTLTVPNIVTNSLFEDNYSRLGAGIYNFHSSPRVVNSTFTKNISQFGSGVASDGRDSDQPSVINSIFWDNLDIFGQTPIYDNGSITGVSFSLVEGGASGNENIDAEPLFVNPNNFDYRLSSGSPAIDSGTNDVFVAPNTTDLAGNPRIVGARIDLGAYEGAALEPVPTVPQVTNNPQIIYVDRDATGANNGTSWGNAYSNLQTALTNAPFGSQIWVADGTYLPSLDEREVSFQLRNTIALYGGFAGGETSLSQRNVAGNPTILSGEIGLGSDINDNSYHVVNASNVTSSAILDGFTIRGGNANLFSGIDRSGGGIYSSASQATFRNLRLEDNNAFFGGGVFIEQNSSHIFTNVTFTRNNADRDGGAVYNAGNSTFFNNQFRNNTAGGQGGAVHNFRSNIYIEGATFDSNRATDAGGAIYFADNAGNTRERIINSVFNNNDSPSGGAIYNFFSDAEGINLTFANNEAENGAAVYSQGRDDDVTPEYYNSIFWDNQGTSDTAQIFNNGENTIVRNSIVEGGFPGQETLNANPVFVDQEAGNLRIRSTSPAIDAGLNEVVIEEQDLADRPRIFNGTVDIGAYEYSQPYLAINNPEVTVATTGEPSENAEATFVIRLLDAAGELAPRDSAISVDYRTLNNTAVSESDYVARNGTLTFVPQETEKRVTVPVLSNTANEGVESFTLELSNVTGNVVDFDPQGTATIRSVNEIVNISINNPTVTEGNDNNTTLNFTVTLDAAATQPVTVDYEIADDTAIAGEDYTDGSGTLTFAPGETEKTIAVDILGDTTDEDNENLAINLTNPSNNATLTNARGIGTIEDNDGNTGGGGNGQPPNNPELQPLELFRFRNTSFATGTYVFVGAAERDAILNNPNLNQTFVLEGGGDPAFVASSTSAEDLIPFFRLSSLDVPGTFLFVSTAEYDAIFAPNSNQRDNWERQGFDREGNDIAEFYLLAPGSGSGVLFNRYQNRDNGTFLYAGPGESDAIDSNPDFSNAFTKQGGAFESLDL